MDVLTLIFNTALQTLLSIGKIALILIPVLMVIELAKFYKVIEKFTGKMKGFLRFLTLPEEAAFPLLAGILFGIVLGSALIIDYAREGILRKRDLRPAANRHLLKYFSLHRRRYLYLCCFWR